jgi:hypothetical protein
MMSQQLTLSSLFSALALALLCVSTSVRDFAGQDAAGGAALSLISTQAGLSPGLLQD